MSEKEIGEILSQISPAMKKELYKGLMGSLINDLSKEEKTEFFQTVLKDRGETPPVIDMVEQ